MISIWRCGNWSSNLASFLPREEVDPRKLGACRKGGLYRVLKYSAVTIYLEEVE